MVLYLAGILLHVLYSRAVNVGFCVYKCCRKNVKRMDFFPDAFIALFLVETEFSRLKKMVLVYTGLVSSRVLGK